MLDKKQFSYSSSKWVIKQWRQLTTSTHLAQKLLTNIQRNGGSRRFAMRALKMSAVASRQKLTTTHWEHHQNWSFYDYVRSCWRTQHGPMVILHLKQIGKAKKLSKWVPHELTTNQKNCRFEVLSSLILHNNKPFLNQILTGNKKWIVYNNLRRPAQWLGQAAAPEHSTKPKMHQKKVTVTVWWSAAHLIDPLQLSGSQQNHYNGEVCPANPWDAQKMATPAAGTGQLKGPNSSWRHLTAGRTTNTLKVERTGLRSFALSTTFTWPLANLLPLFQASWQLFAGKTLSQAPRGRKCFPRVCWIPKHGFLCFRNKSTYFSLAKMCWL